MCRQLRAIAGRRAIPGPLAGRRWLGPAAHHTIDLVRRVEHHAERTWRVEVVLQKLVEAYFELTCLSALAVSRLTWISIRRTQRAERSSSVHHPLLGKDHWSPIVGL